MTNETLITASGVIRNRSKPRVGVLSIHSVNGDFLDELDQGIDLGYIEAREELEAEARAENPNADENEIENIVNDAFDCYESTGPVIFGAYKKNADGKYEIDTTGGSGEYAGTYSRESGNICVEWSKHTTPCRCTSPCYVMADGSGPCGDLNSEGDDVIAYTLPADCFRNKDGE